MYKSQGGTGLGIWFCLEEFDHLGKGKGEEKRNRPHLPIWKGSEKNGEGFVCHLISPLPPLKLYI